VVKDIVAGALFDFVGFLTTLQEPVTLSARDDTSRPLRLLQEFAASRGLDLSDANVMDWQDEIG
jgi:hypothetical protein